MLGFFKKNKKTQDPQEENKLPEAQVDEQPNPQASDDDSTNSPKVGLFQKFKQGLSKTRQQFTSGIANLVLGKKIIDQQILDEIETQLLLTDMGVECTQQIIADLTNRVQRKQLNDAQALYSALEENLSALLQPCEAELSLSTNGTTVLLMVGMNGAGKTTTIGKIAKHYQQQGKSVMLAAGDTFRAAAVEQLQVWGERNNIAVIAQPGGSDSASVIYDAMQAANARNIDILLADTAGRLHTQVNLMEELKKVKRVIQKINPEAPHEIMLVLDATIGQNALVQAIQFNEAVEVSGITLTKLDGTAKGGIVFAIAKKLGLPIRYIGVGESIDDLKPFNAKLFVDALLSDTDH